MLVQLQTANKSIIRQIAKLKNTHQIFQYIIIMLCE